MERMKMTVGLGCADRFDETVRAGADEVFCGYVPEKWMEAFGTLRPLNRRESIWTNAQAGPITEMRILKEKANRAGIPVAVTLNAPVYSPPEMPLLAETAELLVREGFDRLIVGNMAALTALNESGVSKNCRIHISGEIGEVNRGMLPLLQRMGTRRVIFHRKMSFGDMRLLSLAMARFSPPMEAEAFAMNELCHFTGAYCSTLHGDLTVPMCRIPWIPGGVSDKKSPPEGAGMRFGAGNGCGLCALRKLRESGVTVVKMAGRGARAEDMPQRIALLRDALCLEAECKTEEEYLLGLCRLLGGKCGGECYYPEAGRFI
ncbi:MAG: U32 family peptidase [Clostridia bacterium]|nr:U32 family peptidase [Clostridia bacterium]